MRKRPRVNCPSPTFIGHPCHESRSAGEMLCDSELLTYGRGVSLGGKRRRGDRGLWSAISRVATSFDRSRRRSRDRRWEEATQSETACRLGMDWHAGKGLNEVAGEGLDGVLNMRLRMGLNSGRLGMRMLNGGRLSRMMRLGWRRGAFMSGAGG